MDLVLIAAQVVTGLKSLVSRRRNALEEGVVSVTQVTAGHAFNVIPGRGELRGTARTFGGRFYEGAPRLVQEAAQGVAGAVGGRADGNCRPPLQPTVKEPRTAEAMAAVAPADVR